MANFGASQLNLCSTDIAVGRADRMSGTKSGGAVGSWVRMVLVAVLVAAAVASLVFMFRVGGRNPSALLVALFTGWVASPFVGACVLTIAGKRLSARGQVGIAVVSLIITAGALACYGGAIAVVGTRPAFMYLMVPLASWVLLAPLGVAALFRMRRSLR